MLLSKVRLKHYAPQSCIFCIAWFFQVTTLFVLFDETGGSSNNSNLMTNSSILRPRAPARCVLRCGYW